LLAEALNRRVRDASDLDFAASAPVLGELIRTARSRDGRGLRLLRNRAAQNAVVSPSRIPAG
jgi:hypothetical protein